MVAPEVFFVNSKMATEYGVEESIIIQQFTQHMHHNKVNNMYNHDGRTWLCSSLDALTTMFPFWTKKQVRHWIDKLVSKDVLLKGKYNENPLDQTLWYAFKHEDKFLG